MALSSGSTNFNPPLADLVVEAYSRIQIRGPSLTSEHIIEARRSMNLILSDWSGNRSVNLWAVDLVTIPLIAGVATYVMPDDTIQVLDVYTRQFQANSTFTTIGTALTPLLAGGVPLVNQFGDPILISPGSGTLSTVAGSQVVTLTWPASGLTVGAPIFFNGLASVGALVLTGPYTVDTVIDSNTVTFFTATPALETQTGAGATPLIQTINGSANANVIYPNHGMVVGSSFTVWTPTTVGGITFTGAYTVSAVANSYQFTIVAATTANASTAAFIDGGQLQVTSQATNVNPIDLIIYGLSRTEYASIPDKFSQGRPTSFWFDRTIVPTMTVWEVPPPAAQLGGMSYALAIYRMRKVRDANPVNGQVGDFPSRFYLAFSTELTAALAEKFKPEAFEEKLKIADLTWQRASSADEENVPWFITPGLSGYYDQ